MVELTPEQIAEYQDVFNVFDKDGNGFISAEELSSLIGELNGKHPTEEEVKKMIKKFDQDGDEEIDFGEFCEIMKQSTKDIDAEIEAAFRSIDTDGNGTLDKEEVGALFEKLGQPQSEEELTNLFNYIDTDGNGEIDKDEFKNMYTKLNIRPGPTTTGKDAVAAIGDNGNDGTSSNNCCIIV